jgi:hypothetical protein
MDFGLVLDILIKRPRMMLHDDRYATFVAFIEGYDTAVGNTLLSGFQEWVAEQLTGSSINNVHWAWLIIKSHSPKTPDQELAQHLLQFLGTFLELGKDSAQG